jgi:hypothetical protein
LWIYGLVVHVTPALLSGLCDLLVGGYSSPPLLPCLRGAAARAQKPAQQSTLRKRCCDIPCSHITSERMLKFIETASLGFVKWAINDQAQCRELNDVLNA